MPFEPYHAIANHQPTPQEVAQWTGGALREADHLTQALRGLATLREAGEYDISFITDQKFVAEAHESRAGLIITAAAWDLPGRARVVVEEVWPAVARLMEKIYAPPRPAAQVHPTAVLGEGVRLGEGVSVGPYCVIGDGCVLGADVVLGPHCILDRGCTVGGRTRLVARVTLTGPVRLGERVLIHPGAVLGTDGFAFKPSRVGLVKIPQVGTVVVEDDVEIGANTTIDRAFLYETRIGRGTKLDNLVHIAHNVQVGPWCIMAAQAGVAGSTKIGKGCILAGQAGVGDGLTITDGVTLAGQTGVHTNMPTPGVFQGSPPLPIKDFFRVAAASQRLPEALRRLRALEQKVAEGEKSETGKEMEKK